MKRLLWVGLWCRVILPISSTTDLIVETSGFLQQLEDTVFSFVDDLVLFDQVRQDISQLDDFFDVLEQKQAIVVPCIESKHSGLLNSLSIIESTKEALLEILDINKNALSTQIELLQQSSQEVLSSITDEINNLSNEIDEYQDFIITVSSITQENVTNALSLVDSIRSDHSQLVDERADAISDLEILIEQIRLYTDTNVQEVASLKDVICQ